VGRLISVFEWLRRRRAPASPRDADSAARAALLAVLDRDHERAEQLLVASAELDSRGVEPYLALARFYRTRGDIGRAIRIHQNLLLRRDLDREQRLACLADLAADFRQGGFLQRAIASYEEVLERDPKHVAALRALVKLLGDVRDHQRAIAMQRRLARVENRDPAAEQAELWVDMAEAAHAEGRTRDARRAAKRALRANLHSVRAWILLGTLEAERGRSKAALAAWQRVPTIDRKSGALVYPRIESAYAALDRSREFEAYLRGLLAERGDDLHVHLALGRALAARGEIEEALAELRRVLERDPEHLGARAALGRLLLSEHRDPEAAKEYAELLDVLERCGLLRARARLG
jgi:lipopolysaccharide biosynthesis regulator YciM